MAKRKPVAVKATQDSDFLYGFYTKSSTVAATFGHTDLEGGSAPTKTVVFSPSSIEPTKATKSLASGSDSSFADTSKLNALITADYNLNRRRRSVPKETAKSKIVGIHLEGGVYWCWRMPITRWASIPADVKTAAGIIEITAFNPKKHAFNGNAVVLRAAAGGFLAGQVIDKSELRRSFTNPTTGKNIRIYAKLQDDV